MTLLIALIAYSVAATFVPRGASNDAGVSAWAATHPVAEAIASRVGLHHAFAAPIFLALATLLALATAACATERTTRALRLVRALRSGEGAERARRAQGLGGSVRIANGVEPGDALIAATRNLKGLRLRVRRSETQVDAHSGAFGLLGSPLFHWTIVALMLVIAAGQATRAEGFLGLPLGERVIDQRSSYLQVTEGPLFSGRYSGLEFVASSLERHHIVDGIDVGPAPYVTAYRAGISVASGRVYPNNPLRVGALMVHMVEFGPAVTLSLEATDGAELAREQFLLDRSAEAPSGTKPQQFRLATLQSAPLVDGRVQVVVRRPSASGTATTAPTTVLLEISQVGRPIGPPVALGVGDAVDLPGGERLRVAEVRDWVRVSVANDWSVWVIYVLLVVAIAALAVALLVPTRRVTILLYEHESAWHMRVRAWHSSKDPTFQTRVARAVRDAAGAGESR